MTRSIRIELAILILALRLETRFQKAEPKSESKMTKLKPHHRLELNDVFQKEIQFHFKLDVSSTHCG